MKKKYSKTNLAPGLKLDKKTGHVLEVPTTKQVRDRVKKLRQEQPQPEAQPSTVKVVEETEADRNFKKVQKVIDRMHAKAKLPKILRMARHKFLSTVCVINRDARKRELLRDKPGCHVMFCHRKMAKVFTSDVCLICKIQQSYSTTDEGSETWHDGSWSIVPCRADKSNYTTIQEVRRRPWFLFRRYWYEISFDGHVQPAMMLQDYQLNPARKKQHFYVTREYVKVRHQDAENDYFRFWLTKPSDYGEEQTEE